MFILKVKSRRLTTIVSNACAFESSSMNTGRNILTFLHSSSSKYQVIQFSSSYAEFPLLNILSIRLLLSHTTSPSFLHTIYITRCCGMNSSCVMSFFHDDTPASMRPSNRSSYPTMKSSGSNRSSHKIRLMTSNSDGQSKYIIFFLRW